MTSSGFIDKGDAMMALYRQGFFETAPFATAGPGQLLLDGSDSNTAQVASGYAQAVVMAYNTKILTSAIENAGTL